MDTIFNKIEYQALKKRSEKKSKLGTEQQLKIVTLNEGVMYVQSSRKPYAYNW